MRRLTGALNMLGKFWRKLKNDRRGNVLVIVAIGATSMVGAAGMGVDTVQWYLWQKQLQNSVDGGALSGAHTLFQSGNAAQAAKDELKSTFAHTYTVVRAVSPPTSGDYAGDTGAVELVATTSQTLPFSSLFLPAAPTITARAVAATVDGGKYCVISLADDGEGISVIGSAKVNLGCGATANSNFSTAVDLDGSSFLGADPINAVGGIGYTAKNVPSDGSVLPYGLKTEDPLASRGLMVPSSTSCLSNKKMTIQPNDDVDLPEGRYCGGLDIKGTVNLTGGLYVIDGGTLKINSGAKVTSSAGVTIILTGASAATVAEVDIAGGATLDLHAHSQVEDATWYDILFFQDPKASDISNTINGDASLSLDGIAYFPTNDLTFTGGGGTAAKCLLLVAKRVKFGGDTGIDNDCSDTIEGLDTTARIIRVVE